MATKKTSKNNEVQDDSNSRRDFIKKSGLFTALALTPPSLVMASENKWDEKIASYIETVPLSIEVNGTKHNLNIEPRTTLLDLLREQLLLTGTKKGCDLGECGCCSVHLDGKPVLSCLMLAIEAQGREITTIEGVAHGNAYHLVQVSMVEEGAIQCGFCTPAMVMNGIYLLSHNKNPSGVDIKECISGTLCRCTGYTKIEKAIEKAAQQMGKA